MTIIDNSSHLGRRVFHVFPRLPRVLGKTSTYWNKKTKRLPRKASSQTTWERAKYLKSPVFSFSQTSPLKGEDAAGKTPQSPSKTLGRAELWKAKTGAWQYE